MRKLNTINIASRKKGQKVSISDWKLSQKAQSDNAGNKILKSMHTIKKHRSSVISCPHSVITSGCI